MRGSQLTASEKAALGAITADGVWTQAKLHAAGLEESDLCKRCGEKPDTLWHRAWECGVMRNELLESVPLSVHAAAISAGEASLAYSRGIFSASAVAPPPKVEGEPAYWYPEGGHPNGHFGKHVFIDGSYKFRALGKDFARASWAVIEVGEDGEVVDA